MRATISLEIINVPSSRNSTSSRNGNTSDKDILGLGLDGVHSADDGQSRDEDIAQEHDDLLETSVLGVVLLKTMDDLNQEGEQVEQSRKQGREAQL